MLVLATDVVELGNKGRLSAIYNIIGMLEY